MRIMLQRFASQVLMKLSVSFARLVFEYPGYELSGDQVCRSETRLKGIFWVLSHLSSSSIKEWIIVKSFGENFAFVRLQKWLTQAEEIGCHNDQLRWFSRKVFHITHEVITDVKGDDSYKSLWIFTWNFELEATFQVQFVKKLANYWKIKQK